MKVLITCGVIGGAGGVERAVFEICRALDDCEIDVVTGENAGGELAEFGPHVKVRLSRNLRIRGSGRRLLRPLNGLRSWLLPNYDLHLAWMHGPEISSTSRAALRVLIPAGNVPPKAWLDKYDVIALEAPANTELLPEGLGRLLSPPVGDLPPPKTPDDAIPEDYFLTVFNPYMPSKGAAELERFADQTEIPVVWCHSDLSIAFEMPPALQEHTNIIHAPNPTRAELHWLYKSCSAYLSFSQSEGFGWSIADALRYSPVVVSRPVGVMSCLSESLPGIFTVDELRFSQVKEMIGTSVLGAHRNPDLASVASFRGRINEMCRDFGIKDLPRS